VRKHNKPRPHVAHRGIARFLGIDQKCNQSSHCHSTPSLKIAYKSVQPFSRNLANKETKKDINRQTYKQRNRSKTIPRLPMYRGRGNKHYWKQYTCTLAVWMVLANKAMITKSVRPDQSGLKQSTKTQTVVRVFFVGRQRGEIKSKRVSLEGPRDYSVHTAMTGGRQRDRTTGGVTLEWRVRKSR